MAIGFASAEPVLGLIDRRWTRDRCWRRPRFHSIGAKTECEDAHYPRRARSKDGNMPKALADVTTEAARLTPDDTFRTFATRCAGHGLGSRLHGMLENGGSRGPELRLPGPHRLEAQDIALSRR